MCRGRGRGRGRGGVESMTKKMARRGGVESMTKYGETGGGSGVFILLVCGRMQAQACIVRASSFTSFGLAATHRMIESLARNEKTSRSSVRAMIPENRKASWQNQGGTWRITRVINHVNNSSITGDDDFIFFPSFSLLFSAPPRNPPTVSYPPLSHLSSYASWGV